MWLPESHRCEELKTLPMFLQDHLEGLDATNCGARDVRSAKQDPARDAFVLERFIELYRVRDQFLHGCHSLVIRYTCFPGSCVHFIIKKSEATL
jgi:hypothetical protein